MRRGDHRRSLALLLALLLLRLAVPAGFMVSPAAGLALIPCPAASVHAAAVHAGHGPDGQPATGDHQSCPYAALSAPYLPPHPGSVEAPPPAGPTIEPALPRLVLSVAPAAGMPPFARGPPSPR
ncbi:MAG: hypothetical protein JOZ90_09220 [Alphaproteobacteria bacterium]|nr:hypothetical protein [Alphaproteobacteria bacterium]MBV9372372.1 hypothetical protein [Alphaproteobacteria bacterium]MBV9901264.1 hypothetical protein [Alphaproteobacteria bacterium]